MTDRPTDTVPIILCDVRAIGGADLGTVDALAHMQLAARRIGLGIRIVGASSELRELLMLAGLEDILPCLEDERSQ
ncbi:hypothetical protein BH23CHL8_BH23CHL8_09750 [soil metagenome]